MHVVAVLHQPALQQGELVVVVFENGDTHAPHHNAPAPELDLA